MECTRSLRLLLQPYGTNPNLTVVLFTLDETVFSRELEPLAAFYPLDLPRRALVVPGPPTPSADSGPLPPRPPASPVPPASSTTPAGLLDPGRHEMSRRLDCGYLAGLVAELRIDEDEAMQVAEQLTGRQPKKIFKL
jgi:glucuronate isomerase